MFYIIQKTVVFYLYMSSRVQECPTVQCRLDEDDIHLQVFVHAYLKNFSAILFFFCTLKDLLLAATNFVLLNKKYFILKVRKVNEVNLCQL